MIIALQPSQVSVFWDSIKHAFSQTNPCPEGVDSATYFNGLLENLLTQKFQVWLVFRYAENGEKNIHAIGITNITQDNLTGEKILHIESLFGVRKLSDELAKESFQELIKYAKNVGCRGIQARSTVPRIFDLALTVGFKKSYEVYSYPIRRKQDGQQRRR